MLDCRKPIPCLIHHHWPPPLQKCPTRSFASESSVFHSITPDLALEEVLKASGLPTGEGAQTHRGLTPIPPWEPYRAGIACAGVHAERDIRGAWLETKPRHSSARSTSCSRGRPKVPANLAGPICCPPLPFCDLEAR